jgi:antitoxin component YwqK of YwqJK toxin-antitoxin module
VRCLLLLPILAATAFAGEAAAPPKDGEHVEKWPDGKPKLEAHYKEGKLHGLFRRWHENGQLAAEEEYQNGKWEGRRAAWWENGQVQFDWRYQEGKLCEGVWKSYHANGAFWTSYKMGIGGKFPDQFQVYYHDNGQVQRRGWWKNEKQEGKWEHFHPDGTRSEVRHYREGLADGWITKWDENGKLISREEWSKGKRKKK